MFMVNTYYDASFADGILFTLQSQETTTQETTPTISNHYIVKLERQITRASSAKTRGFHTQLDEGPETP